MHRLIHSGLIRLFAPERVALFREVTASVGWNAQRTREYQDAKLREIIRYCWDYVPFYRSRWRSFISGPDDIRSIDDLVRLPLLNKDEVREELVALTSTEPGIEIRPARTGGSTARPVIYGMTKHEEELMWALIYLGWSWAGYRIGAPFLVVGGESIGAGLTDRRTRKDWVMNRWVSTGSNLTLDRTRTLVGSPHFSKIELIYGYPNAIRELGEFLAEIGAKPHRLRGVVCTAEVMRPEVRQRISETLGGVDVLDQYGLNDGGLFAVEGPDHQGLHVFPQRAVLEIVDDQAAQIWEPNRSGRAIATSLSNHAMPFVRYETGDEIHWLSSEPSPSGINWPRIGPVDGRIGDVIFLPSGRRIAMPGLTLVMRWMDGLHAYQFIQTGPRSVTARLQRGPAFALSVEEAAQYLRTKISDEIDWQIVWDAPELTGNQKLLVIRNDWLRSQGLSRPPRA